jgi:curli biogenesis system outer membrane secretion channel CsgG
MQLDSPAALIKIYVSQSKCFTLVDRGKGLAAAKAERELAASGEERVGSNIGKGQMKAADYVLVPDIANRNGNAQGTNVGGALGGLLGHGIGAVVGGVSLKSKTADVVLTLTDVRSTEQVALEQGHAKKTDLGWMGGGGLGFFGGFAAGGASSYANTEIGQVVAMAYLDAYTKLVNDVKSSAPDAKADNVQQAVTMAKPGKLYTKPDLKSRWCAIWMWACSSIRPATSRACGGKSTTSSAMRAGWCRPWCSWQIDINATVNRAACVCGAVQLACTPWFLSASRPARLTLATAAFKSSMLAALPDTSTENRFADHHPVLAGIAATCPISRAPAGRRSYRSCRSRYRSPGPVRRRPSRRRSPPAP